MKKEAFPTVQVYPEDLEKIEKFRISRGFDNRRDAMQALIVEFQTRGMMS